MICPLGHPPHRLCAVCHSTHRTHRLCDACKKDPANEGWNGDDEAHPSDAVDSMRPQCRLADIQTQEPVRQVTIREHLILHLLHNGYARERVRHRTRRCYVWRRRPMKPAEVAALVGVSRQYVRKLILATMK